MTIPKTTALRCYRIGYFKRMIRNITGEAIADANTTTAIFSQVYHQVLNTVFLQLTKSTPEKGAKLPAAKSSYPHVRGM